MASQGTPWGRSFSLRVNSSDFTLRLGITSMDCGATVCTGGRVSHRKALARAKQTS